MQSREMMDYFPKGSVAAKGLTCIFLTFSHYCNNENVDTYHKKAAVEYRILQQAPIFHIIFFNVLVIFK